MLFAGPDCTRSRRECTNARMTPRVPDRATGFCHLSKGGAQWEPNRWNWVMSSAALHVTEAVHSEMTYILVTLNILQKQFHVRRRS